MNWNKGDVKGSSEVIYMIPHSRLKEIYRLLGLIRSPLVAYDEKQIYMANNAIKACREAAEAIWVQLPELGDYK